MFVFFNESSLFIKKENHVRFPTLLFWSLCVTLTHAFHVLLLCYDNLSHVVLLGLKLTKPNPEEKCVSTL